MGTFPAVRQALGLLSRRDRRLLVLATLAQMGTSILDLIGVLLLGLVGALAVTVVQSQEPPELVNRVSDWLGVGGLSPYSLVLVLVTAGAFFLLLKSVVAIVISRRILMFLANRQALVTARLSSELLHAPAPFLAKRSSQETAYALIPGAGAATIQLLGQAVVAVTELSLLVLMTAALLFVDPWVTFGAIAFFAAVAGIIHRMVGRRASSSASTLAQMDILGMNAVQEAIGAYREVSVSRRRLHYVDRIQQVRWSAARHIAELQFMSLFPKYLLEAALMVGGLLLAGFLFLTQSAVVAVGTLALFLAAGSRVMPAILRFQVALIGVRNASGIAEVTFTLAEELNDESEVTLEDAPPNLSRQHDGFSADLRFEDVTLTYEGADRPALNRVTFDARAGESVAIAGPSGAGKSTLADVLLGVLAPDEGEVVLSGLPVEEALTTWAGAVAYVPQHVFIADASLRQNVALGLPVEDVPDEVVLEALSRANLLEFVQELPNGLDEPLGEYGARISGGQRQRIGVARALLTSPKLVVLDEATSALDADTENAITQMLRSLANDVTVVIIAHRLSTIRKCDQVLYLDDGQLLGRGTFDELVAHVPAFARQAALMGIGHDPS